MSDTSATKDAIAVAIEVDGRQRYLFETDKLQEMLGASRIMAMMVEKAEKLFKGEDNDCIIDFSKEYGPFLFSPVSGEIRAWAMKTKKKELLDAAWTLREWLEEHGVPHSVAFLETRSGHFEGASGDKAKCELENGEPVEPPEGVNDLSWVHWALGERIRKRKDAKAGGDARPRCSLFASCRLHGTDAANVLQKDRDGEKRRELIGWRAERKREIWSSPKGRREIYRELATAVLQKIGTWIPDDGHEGRNDKAIAELSARLSQDISKFEGQSDSYIGYACGDGDGMGDLLSNLHWNDCGSDRWGSDKRAPWQRNRDFSFEFDTLVKEAFCEAVKNTPVKNGSPIERQLLPQLIGGDDLWMVGNKEVILSVAREFTHIYETKASGYRTLDKALNVANRLRVKKNPTDPDLSFTVSIGLAFAKSGHPLSDTVAIAEGLMKSAKTLRKGEVPVERKAPDPYQGCIDWHWVESSKSEEIKDARAKGWMYNGTNGEVMLLTTRPWTHEETATFREAAETFVKVPRRKREQLEQILRMGKTLGDLAWKSWWDGLRNDHDYPEKVTVKKTMHDLGIWNPFPKIDEKDDEKLDTSSPWVELVVGKVYATPFLDILALQHVLGLDGSEQEVQS